MAILTGDLLFARASSIVAELGPEAVKVQAQTFERLVTGQTRETVGPSAGEDPVEHYLSVLADKTGALIATSGRFGAEFAGAPPEIVDVMVEYGERIGVAFQLADDLIDLDVRDRAVRQDAGHRPARGRPDPAGAAARASDDPADAELHELLDGDLHDDDRHARALALLRAHPSLKQARAPDHASGRTAPGRRWRRCRHGPVRDALDALAEGVVTRDG